MRRFRVPLSVVSPVVLAGAPGLMSAAYAGGSPPTVPDGIVAEALSRQDIHVSWDSSTDPDGGTIYYQVHNKTDNRYSGWLTETEWVDSGLKAHTSYEFRVRARDFAVPPNFPNISAWSETVSEATWGVGFPRIGTYGTLIGAIDGIEWHEMDAERKAEIMRFDFLTMDKPPGILEEMHDLNPEALIFYQWMPQFARNNPDPGYTDWNLRDYITKVAWQNNWILRTVTDEPVTIWNWALLNFTPHCPLGTDGSFDADAVGRTAAEWIAEFAIPRFVEDWNGHGAEYAWTPGSLKAYNGIVFEVILESFWDNWLMGYELDYDNDGVEDSRIDFYDAWGPTSLQFLDEVRALSSIGDNYPIIAGGDSFAPPMEEFQGIKIEDVYNRFPSWNEEFFGVWDRLRGYVLARDRCRRSWDLTLVDLEYWNRHDDLALRDREVRWWLGTTCLGDGYFIYNVPHPIAGRENPPAGHPLWFPEYDLNLGQHGDDFQEISVAGGQQIYLRYFYDSIPFDPEHPSGLVVVNPNPNAVSFDLPQAAIASIPSEDALFREADDMDFNAPDAPVPSLTVLDNQSIRADWDAVSDPEGHDPVESLLSWKESGAPGLPATSGWISGTTHTANGLLGGVTYDFWLRVRDGLGNASSAGGTATATTQNEPPSVEAGDDQVIGDPVTFASLDATVVDDGNHTVLWEKTIGAGNVIFQDASAEDTIATFEKAGTYQLRITVDDGDHSVSDSISITIYPVLTSIEIQPGDVTVGVGETFQFWVLGYDQFGSQMWGLPSWEVVENDGGTIGPWGQYTAPDHAGTYTVRAWWETIEDSVQVTVVN